MRSSAKAPVQVELDLGRYELRRSGRPVRLEKKPMELLIFLVGRRDRLVPRQDIVSKLWHSDLFIDTERNLNNVVRKIRTALGDDPARPRFLETVVGKGYRFVGPIRVIDPQAAIPAGAASPATDAALWRGDRTSLAVVPLRPLGDTTTDDHGVSLGFADALISRLANLPGVDVLPTTAVLSIPVEASPREIASRLGVRFVAHGAIQSLGTQSRLSIELFDGHLQSSCFSRRCELDLSRLPELKDDIASRIAGALNRPLSDPRQRRPRYSRDPLAYAQFMQGYRRSSSGNPKLLEEATGHLMNAVARDPDFALAHAELSYVCAVRHFEFDPSRVWLEKAEFHCRRSLELDPDLPEGHVANAFLLWGPSKNFQHLEAIAELKRALSLQKNLPHAYNRMGTILAHIGLLDHARNMYQMGSAFHPRKTVSHSIFQAYLWSGDYDRAAQELEQWRKENPASKYAIHFAPYLALLTNHHQRAKALLDESSKENPGEPLIVSMEGLLHAIKGRRAQALNCVARACASPRSFGHAHHTHYQIACIFSVLKQPEAGFEWLERSVDTGFACWPFFLKDPHLSDVRELPEFEILVSSLQAKYPDHLGML